MNRIPYIIALYIRLSVEDLKAESMSIENQKYALHQYVDAMEDVSNPEVQEYIDNGLHGQRPFPPVPWHLQSYR